MRRLLGFHVLVLVFFGSVVAAPRMGRARAGAELSPQASEALQVLITTAGQRCQSPRCTSHRAELRPDAPEVYVCGFALMGGVEVRTRKPKRKD